MQSKDKSLSFMDSFKVYLPSNVSDHLYPDNSPCNYRTRFAQPIDLDGHWEVGLESILYSTNVNDENEKAQIDFEVKTNGKRTVNSSYPYEMCAPEGNWKGIAEIIPKHFEKDSSKLERIIECINSINSTILNPHKRSQWGDVFEFYLTDDKKVSFRAFDSAFTIILTSRLASALGFNYRSTFSGTTVIKGSSRTQEFVLNREDYKITYYNTNVLKKKGRFIIKDVDKKFDGTKETFNKLWQENIRKHYDIHIEFKGSKLVIHNYEKSLVIVFSRDFSKTFGHEWPIYGKGSQWAVSSADLKEGFNSQVWYLDIYSKELDFTNTVSKHNLTMDILLGNHDKHKELYTYINQSVSTFLKQKLGDKYDTSQHSFNLSIYFDAHCKLIVGDMMTVRFSKNLSYLLGFPNKLLKNTVMSVRGVTSLSNRKRQLFVLTNAIKPTAYGNQKLQILQDFVHNSTGAEIVEKLFNPIVYLPIMSNYIDMIQIQLTDELHQPLPIKDSKTIVTLYFRKMNEKQHIV